MVRAFGLLVVVEDDRVVLEFRITAVDPYIAFGISGPSVTDNRAGSSSVWTKAWHYLGGHAVHLRAWKNSPPNFLRPSSPERWM